MEQAAASLATNSRTSPPDTTAHIIPPDGILKELSCISACQEDGRSGYEHMCRVINSYWNLLSDSHREYFGQHQLRVVLHNLIEEEGCTKYIRALNGQSNKVERELCELLHSEEVDVFAEKDFTFEDLAQALWNHISEESKEWLALTYLKRTASSLIQRAIRQRGRKTPEDWQDSELYRRYCRAYNSAMMLQMRN